MTSYFNNPTWDFLSVELAMLAVLACFLFLAFGCGRTYGDD